MTDNDRADADEESDLPTIELTPEHEQEEYEPPSDEEIHEWYDETDDYYGEEAHKAADRLISDYEGGESAEPSDDETESEKTHQQTLIPETDDRGIDHVAGSVARFHFVEGGGVEWRRRARCCQTRRWRLPHDIPRPAARWRVRRGHGRRSTTTECQRLAEDGPSRSRTTRYPRAQAMWDRTGRRTDGPSNQRGRVPLPRN